MKPCFSLKYNGIEYNSSQNNEISTSDGSVYEIDKNITVTLKANTYSQYDAVEWVLYFENKSPVNSGIISDINDCDMLLPIDMPKEPNPGYRPKEGDACVITMTGMVDGFYYWENDSVSAQEYQFNYEYLDKAYEKRKTFANVGGRSSEGMMPFFDVTANNKGYIAAVGWTGDWKTEFSRVDGGITMKSGLKETCFYLQPGEKIRTSSVLIMKYDNDKQKHNKFRRLIKDHFSHKSCTAATRDGLMAFELWGGLPSEEMKKRINDLHKFDINFEEIWIDAGWYGECTKCDEAFSGDWSERTGDWEVNTRVHPGELKDVMECANAADMNIMLWMEPERAITGTKMIEKHPNWFLTCDGTTSNILNYGNEDALAYICETLSYYIEKLKLSCYRQDFNVQLTEFFKKADEENRRGITEIKHIMGMYKFWDYILKKYPGLMIDNCSSGGRRIDIETMKRSVPFFRSDYQCNFNENPEVLQAHNANISAYIPYNGCTSKTKSDTYAIRSSYSCSWGGAFYNAVFQSMNDEDLKWAKKITDEYRRIRRYFCCDFYNHGSVCFDDTSWAIWQYHNEEKDSGIVMAFRRSNSPFEQTEIKLEGLVSDRVYIFTNLNDNTVFEGAKNLKISLPQKRSSVIFEYIKKD